MLFHHLMRYTIATLSSFMDSQKTTQTDVRKQVSGACLRQLLFGVLPTKPEEITAS
jgi:hypothetical protein